MIYIIEGPDGSGKTTLANRISAATGATIIHFSQPKEGDGDMFEMYAKAIKDADNVIFDRCWHSELCYGPVMRGRSELTKEQCEELNDMAADKGAVVIYCSSDPDDMWIRAKKRGEDYVLSIQDHYKIYEAYERMYGLQKRLLILRYSF